MYENKIVAKGTILSNLFFGQNPLIDLYTPYKIEIDLKLRLITISKRNYYLVGVDKTTIPFKNIRSIEIDRHLFGADIKLKVYGAGLQVVYCISKKNAKLIHNLIVTDMAKSKSINIS